MAVWYHRAVADMDDLSEYLPGRSRKPEPPKPSAKPAKPPVRVGAASRPPAPGRPGGKKPPEPTPPPKWREYANNPAVVAALFAMAVLSAAIQLPGMFRARPPYDTHPCCGMKFYDCTCGCQQDAARCTCPGHRVIHPLAPDTRSVPAR